MKMRAHVLSPSVARGIAVMCAVLFVATAHTAQAGANVWTSHGPPGGDVYALAIDPKTPTTLHGGGAGFFNAQPGPWQRTEVRTPCADFNVTRNAYFGDTHVHTTYSLDAVVFNTLNAPRDAYRFANGEAIGLAPYDGMGNPARTIQLGRPLDFTAVTDHAEGFGTQSVCFLPGLPGYDSSICQELRTASSSGDPAAAQLVNFKLFAPIINSATLLVSICGAGPAYADCASRQSLFWQDLQAAAEEFYDRSSACTFTSFVAYEWTGTPAGANLHRNVIFRNAAVPALPVTYLEQQTPQGLWATLKAQCQDSLASCDWLAIPHNSNVSHGRMFAPENADGSQLTAADAATRAAMEPLVEILTSSRAVRSAGPASTQPTKSVASSCYRPRPSAVLAIRRRRSRASTSFAML